MKPENWEKIKSSLLWIADLIVNVAIVFGVVLLIEKFLVTPFDIYGPSMCDSMNYINQECTKEYGEKIILNKAKYYVESPKRGDIVVFVPKSSEKKYFIKRIIGLPGETVEILDGEIYISNKEYPKGIKLEESYLNEENRHNTESFHTGYKVFQIPEGEYFVMGDNRNASTDSRTCFKSPYSEGCGGKIDGAFVPLKNIEGKAWISFWPVSKMRLIEDPVYIELENQISSLEAK